MFGSRKPIDADQALTKFKDGRREPLRRLRSLHTAHDLTTSERMKGVYRDNYSLIYYLFHESFTSLESTLKLRGGRARQLNETQQDLYDVVLLTLERILIYIPEQVQRRWQANSMGLVIRKLLHPGNQLKLRKKAVQFVILWLQDLQTKASPDILELFGSVVPGVNNAPLSDSTQPFCKPTSVFHVPLDEHDPVLQTEIVPILPATEPPNDETTKELFLCVLQGITFEFQRILWQSVEQRIRGFVYLFEQFKIFYIKPLFPDVENAPSVYGQTIDLPMLPSRQPSPPPGGFTVQHTLQDMIIRWVVDKLTARRLLRNRVDALSEGSEVPSSPLSRTNSPELSDATFGIQLEGDLSTLSKDQQRTNARRFIRQVLMSKKDNVDLVHCVFHQGFHLPLTHLGTIRTLVMLYQRWIKEPSSRPPFMQEPERANDVTDCPMPETSPFIALEGRPSSIDSSSHLLDPVQEDDELAVSRSSSDLQFLQLTAETVTAGADSVENQDSQSEKDDIGPTAEAVDLTAELEKGLSVTEAEDDTQVIEMSCFDEKTEATDEEVAIAEAVIDLTTTESNARLKKGWVEDVRAGMQSNLRLFITNVASVFTARAPVEFLDHQVDLSIHVLNFLQTLARDVALDRSTWEHMLATLLHITLTVLKTHDPQSNTETLGSRMAANLLKTLFVSWVRANLVVPVSTTLWNDLLEVLSSQTHWIQVVLEWKKIMVILTRLLAKNLYCLDMNCLPLDVLKQSAHNRAKDVATRQTSKSDKRGSFVAGLDYIGNDKPVQGQSDSGNRLRSKTTGPQNSSPKQRQSSGEDSMLGAARRAVGKARRKDAKPPEQQQSEHTVKGRSSSATEAELVAMFPDERTERQTNTPASILPPKLSPIATRLQRSVTISHTGLSENVRPKVERRTLLSASSEGETERSPGYAGIDVTSHDLEGRLQNLVENNKVEKQEAVSKRDSKHQLFIATASATIDVGSLERDNKLLAARQESNRTKSEGNIGHDVPDLGETQVFMLQTVLEGESKVTALSPTRKPVRKLPTIPPQAGDEPSIGQPNVKSESNLDAGKGRSRIPSKSVLAGGTKRGWTDVAAAILWRQMMGILGNVNAIKQPHIHCEAVKCLADVWEALYKIRENQGVVLDDGLPPPEIKHSPPLFAIAPLVFQAAGMPEEYKAGRLVAYKLMCDMAVKRHDVPPASDYLDHFYRLMQAGLRSPDQDFLSAIILHSYKIFLLPLPGVTVIIADYIRAAERILSSPEVRRDVPRIPALAATGSLLFFPRLYHGVSIEGCCAADGMPLTFETVENTLIELFVRSSKDEKSRNTRCLAISIVSMFAYSELAHQTAHPKLNESIRVILQSLTFPEKVVALVTIDAVRLLSGVMREMLDQQPSLPGLIVETIAYTISLLLISGSGDEIEQKTVVAMLTCLLDWFMILPLDITSLPATAEPETTLRGIVLEVFAAAATDLVVSFDAKANRTLLLSKLSSSPDGPLPPVFSTPQPKESSCSPPHSAPPVGSPMKAFKFPPPSNNVVKLTARSCLSRLSVLYGHYPFACGASQISCHLSERDDNPAYKMSTDTELSDVLLNSPNVQFFSYQNSTIVTVIELPVESGSARDCRVITRDMTGKFVWDSQLLHSASPLPTKTFAGVVDELDDQLNMPRPDRRLSHKLISCSRSSPHVPDPYLLPTYETVLSPDANLLDRLLVHIGTASPECLAVPERRLNDPHAPPDAFDNEAQNALIDALHSQDYDEKDNYAESQKESIMLAERACPPQHKTPLSPFYHCQLMLNYMGLLSWEQRSELELLKKQNGLMRELKHLDQRQCRETHKIAVLYVGRGQEDKQSILANSRGSQLFEEFVAGLAWEIDLGNHPGFIGGLQRNQTTGTTAPYYATSSVEVVFHVATRFPVDEDGSQWLLNKVRHLGNDEIQIVWSEHTRDYRREIIKTQFGDVYIVIYPLHNNLFRIQIIKKPEVPFFGPLFDGAIVDMLTLPHLVRETALNASRAKRSQLSYYQQYFEDRSQYMENAIRKLRLDTTFEEFMTRVVRPAAFVSDKGLIPFLTVTRSEQDSDVGDRSRSQWSPLSSAGEDEPDRGLVRTRASTFTQGDRLRHPSPLQRLKFFDRSEQLSLPDSLNNAGSSLSPGSKRRRRSSSDRLKKIQ